MISAPTKGSWDLQYASNLIENELRITLLLLRSNFFASAGVFLFGVFARYMASQNPIYDVPSLIFKIFVASFAFAYVFDIANQTTSVAEDAINKPYRPIPAGLLTMGEAYWRWGLSWCFFPLLIWFLSGPWAAATLVSWEAWVFFCYAWPKYNNPFMRNMFNGVGVVPQLRMLNAVVIEFIPRSDMSWKLDMLMSLWLFTTIHTQEFHDVEGDRRSNRRTVAVDFGPNQIFWVRLATAIVISGSAAACLAWGLHLLATQQLFSMGLCLFGALHLLGAIATSYRFVFLTSKEASETTYKMYYVPTGMLLVVYFSYANLYT